MWACTTQLVLLLAGCIAAGSMRGSSSPRVVIATCSNFTDCTEDLQGALDTCAPIVRVPALPHSQSWVVRPIHLRCHGQTVDFEATAVLQAKRWAFHKYGGEGMLLVTVHNVSNVTVLGNGGATFRMHRADYANISLYNHSEGRHGIALYGAHNVVLDGLTVTETGGDGVYVSNILGQVGTPNRNITVRNCNLTGNYRNAISVISVNGLLIENTVLALSKGTPPEGGIDMEPNSPENLLQNILLNNVTMFGNTLRSLTFSGHALRANTNNSKFAPVSIVVRDTRILSGGSYGISINTSPKGVPLGSTLDFERVTVLDTAGSGMLLEDKAANLVTTFTDCAFQNVATGGGGPVWIEGNNSPCDGTVFNNVTVTDDQNRPPVKFLGDVTHMSGTIAVKNPHCTKEAVPQGNSLSISCSE